jgi:WD40 repeat protein
MSPFFARCIILLSATMEELQREIERLKAQLEAERQAREKLEEECDLLAEDNERLRSIAPTTAPPVPTTTVASAVAAPVGGMSGESTSSTSAPELDVFVEGESDYAYHLLKSIPNASSGKNVLSTSIFVSNPSLDFGDLVLCGGVDATLRAYDLMTGVERFKETQTAPVLSIDCSLTHVACGNMDGSALVMVMQSLSGESHPVIQKFKDHSKYVIAVRWSRDGEFLATAGHDKVVNIYHKK